MRTAAEISVVILSFMIAWLSSSRAFAQAPGFSKQDDAAESEINRRFQSHAKEAASAYDIRTDSAIGRQLVLHANPILRWTNPVPEKQMHGDVFLWTDDGRPAAVLCLFEM